MLGDKIMSITGYYNEHGYQVETDEPIDGLCYRAGNHALDSQQDGTGTEHQLSLDTIREYCEQTTREAAEEYDVEYSGVKYLNQDEI